MLLILGGASATFHSTMVTPTSKANSPDQTPASPTAATPKLLTLPTPRSPEAAFLHFRQEAEAVQNVTPLRFDPLLAVANVGVGLASLAPHLTLAQEALPKVSIPWVLEIGDLVRATLYAYALNVTEKSSGEIGQQLAKLFKLREPLLLNARALALLGLLPEARVDAIVAGKGSSDGALDLVQLVGLYREHEATIANKHPFSAEWMADAEAVGHWVLGVIRPRGAAEPPKEEKAAARLRDQFWTLVVERDKKLRTVARVVFEDRAEEMVPALQSRRGGTGGGGADDGADDGGKPTPTPEG